MDNGALEGFSIDVLLITSTFKQINKIEKIIIFL
jgi:hypothetical protein